MLRDWLAPYQSGGKLTLLTEHVPVAADVEHDRIRAVRVRSLRSGREVVLQAPYFLDATELGDLLPLTKAEFVVGSEARSETNELHAAESADPNNQQAFTMCFPVEYVGRPRLHDRETDRIMISGGTSCRNSRRLGRGSCWI